MRHVVRCTKDYSDSTAATSDFAPGWLPSTIPVYNQSILWIETTRLESAFLYTSAAEDEYPFNGKIATYPGGGYVADLTEHADEAASLIDELEANRWIDEYTRAVLLEFNVLNANTKLFNQVMLVFEYTTDGSTLWTASVKAVQLYRYAGTAGVVALLSEIACVILMVVLTIVELISICRLRLKYFAEVGNVLQLAALVVFYVAVAIYTTRCLWTVWLIEDLVNNPGR